MEKPLKNKDNFKSTFEINEVEKKNLFSIPPKFLSPEQAAKYLSLSRWTIYKLLAERKLTHWKYGRRTLIDIEDLKKLVKKTMRRIPSQNVV